MISSMTAFSRQEEQGDWGAITFEIRSVNHRYLDLSLRLPDELRGLEGKLREIARGRLLRGKVECSLRYEPECEGGMDVKLNEPLAKQLIMMAEKIAELARHAQPIDCISLMRWPGIIEINNVDVEKLNKAVISLFQKAIDDLLAARKREGLALKKVILERLAEVSEKVAACEKYLPKINELQRERLLSRFNDAKIGLDPTRLEQEMVLLAQKIDVSEECDRLKMHVKEVNRALNSKEGVGRRLDFLLQEMNREANTLGSKSIADETTLVSVDLKVLIEQMREQVQNIE